MTSRGALEIHVGIATIGPTIKIRGGRRLGTSFQLALGLTEIERSDSSDCNYADRG
jgi:hypothetical protein